MILSDIEIHTDHPFLKDIYSQNAFHLCHLFLRHLNKYKTPKTAKVVIILQESNRDSFVKKERDRATELLNIVEIYKDFNHSRYEEEDVKEKKHMLWTIIYESILATGKQLNWDLDPIIQSYHKGLEIELENKWIQIDSLRSKDKAHFATISAHFDFYSFKVYVDIVNKHKEVIIHKKIIDREPSWGWYSFNHFKFSKWTSDREFCFGINKDDPDKIVIKV